MPTIFNYVLGRPAALQTIEEYTLEETPAANSTPVEDAAVEENASILGDTPEA